MKARRWVLGLGALSLTAALSAASCEKSFAGPYACAAGFASCTTSDGCETLTSSDGTSCGVCGHQCSQGAACTNGSCGAKPFAFESTTSPGGLTVAPGSLLDISGKALAWATGVNDGTIGIDLVSSAGGPSTTIAMPGSVLDSCTSNASSPGPYFAIDGANLYYFASNSLVAEPISPGDSGTVPGKGCTTTGCGIGSDSGPGKGVDAGSGAVIASVAACGPLVLSDGTLYFTSSTTTNNGPGSTTFYSIAASARSGSPQSLATVPNWGGGSFVVREGSIYFSACMDNGGCGFLASVPTKGGAVTYSGSAISESGQGVVTADGTNVYMVSSGWNCDGLNNNGDNNGDGNNGGGNCGNQGQACCGTVCNNGLTCMGSTCGTGGDAGLPGGVLSGGTTVAAFPLHGGPLKVLATTQDGSQATSVAVDSTNIYWATATTVWMAPLGGGAPTAIAGNLGPPVVPCSTGASINAVSIASDGTDVYIASPAANAIYRIRVPK